MPEWRDFYSGRFMALARVPGYGVTMVGRAGFDGYFAQNNGDFRVHIAINEFGLRNPEPVEMAAGRIWVVGDSFTFGWGVEQEHIYSSVIAQILGTPTYNVASPGTNVCGYQALVARMPKTALPKAVVVGLVLENDVGRYDCRETAKGDSADKEGGDFPDPIENPRPHGFSLGAVKGFFIRYSAFYNFAVVALKRVHFINEALVWSGLAAREHVDRGALESIDIEGAARSTAREIVHFRTVLPVGIPFVVLLIPARFDIRDRAPEYVRLRETLAGELRRRGVDFIDPIEAFRKAGFGPTHFAHDGHWSPLGHELAGRAVAEWLRGRGIGD